MPTPEPPTPPPNPKAWHVTTFAGGGARGSSGRDGIGTAASFGLPFSIAQSGDTLYVTDFTQHSLRTVHTTTARVGTIVPSSGSTGAHADGSGVSARFNFPRGAAAAGGTLYVADFSNHRIREVRAGADAAAARVSTIVGSGTPGHADGAGTAARFNGPISIAVSGGTLYVTSRRLIRKLEYRDVGS